MLFITILPLPRSSPLSSLLQVKLLSAGFAEVFGLQTFAVFQVRTLNFEMQHLTGWSLEESQVLQARNLLL